MLKVITLFLCLMNSVWAADFINARCTIFDENGSLIKSFPGLLCGFLDNGKRFEVEDKRIKFVNEQEVIVWSHNGLFHHDFKFDQNKKSVLVLDEDTRNVLGCKTRVDVIKRFNLATGKLEQVVDFYELFKNKKLQYGMTQTVLSKAFFRKMEGLYECNTTHINSFAQIDENTAEKNNPIYAKGNWLVHLAWSGIILVFDKDFKELVGQRFVDIEDYRFHDVQFTQDGRILLYVNNLKTENDLVTAIAFVDPNKEGKEGIEIHELKVDGKIFNQAVLGGVQLLSNGEKLISTNTREKGFQATFYDKNWVMKKSLTLFPDTETKRGQAFQLAHLVNLSKFLKNYKGP